MANNNIILEEILKQYKSDSSINDDKNFEYFAAEQLLKDENLDEDEISFGLIGDSNDNGIDGFYILLDGEFIVQIEQVEGKYKELKVYFHQYKNRYRIEEDVVLKFNNAFNDIMNFDNIELNGWHEELKEKIILLRNIILKTATQALKIKFIINHISKANSEDIKDNESYWSKVDNLKKLIKNSGISRLDVEYDFIGGEELKNLSYRKPEYSIDLVLKDSPLTLEFGDNNIGYIALVGLKNYYNFIVENGNLKRYIFDSNVRDYQNKTIVNKEIENTIKNDYNTDFWWLNNGITIIAGKDSTQIGKKLSLKNVQIVNGLQTSYSIYNSLKDINFDEFENDRSLFVKIIICDQKDIIDRIIRATNSQNAIPSSVLRATDTIQRDIEQFFLSKGYYYDRRKNYYRNLGKPRDKIISINLLSQCIVSLVLPDKNPSRARSNPTILIKKDEDYKSVFGGKYDFQVYLNSVLIFKKVDKELKKLISDAEFMADNKLEKIIKLFKFHISRVLISEIIEKGTPVANDLGDEKIIEKIDTNIVQKSIFTLKEIIDEYEQINSQSIDNISKQTEFSKYINKKLNEKFKAKQKC
ncbi:AIPR family protein [Campylobacter ureolyticus]|uniref:AIPR family protein n=1 Tax=Campylobacter ureolyticus TaxID=827 RepID=UPI0022B406A3|nr:AIPR family protein [Campylobacter ureolyticus]MCZ6104775.1 AIPR family protein [Campylobacter ureolyticus]MCZ6157391.1 AIPR family protein [Campylobacter ureolyticus]